MPYFYIDNNGNKVVWIIILLNAHSGQKYQFNLNYFCNSSNRNSFCNKVREMCLAARCFSQHGSNGKIVTVQSSLSQNELSTMTVSHIQYYSQVDIKIES